MMCDCGVSLDSMVRREKSNESAQVLCFILQLLSILVSDDATNAEKTKQEAWAGQGIPYCTAQTFA